LDIIGRSEAFSEDRFQPALVRYDGFLLFTVGNLNNVLSPRFIQNQVWARGVGCQVSGQLSLFYH
jgi:hypothetical protein